MNQKQDVPRYPTNWAVRFLCDCKKYGQAINIQQGVAHEISTQGLCLLSDHHVCKEKKVALQLMIPPLRSGTPIEIIKMIGHSIVTIMKDGKFLTEIEFLHFEENGLSRLEKNLQQHFDPQFFSPTVKRA